MNKKNVDSKKRDKKKLVRKIIIITSAILIFAFLITLVVLPPIIMNDMVNFRVDFKQIYKANEFDLEAEEHILTTADGIKISAFEVFEDKPKAVLIFISGIHNPSVTAYFGHAKFLKEKGYASFLMDMRAHGNSEGNTICLGYKEYLDTQAVVDYIKANSAYDNVPIVVFGVSMGGAVAINSIGQIDDIDALISLSAFSSWDDAFYDNMLNMGIPKFYAAMQKPFVKLYTSVKYGFDTVTIIPKNQIKKLGDRPALIMHSREDDQVPYASYSKIIKNAPSHVDTWVRDGNYHFIVDNDSFLTPEQDIEYIDKIMGFLEKNFNQ